MRGKKNDDDERTSWGEKPGKPIASRGLTRRDLPKIAAKATIGVIAMNGLNPDLDIKN
ncbi:hypothetical protein [Candidatus Frankia alpina]|uniref:hypothetical protein n=1 Tax=Candidatus Frankia alpina TaxID=2699483 RepID=UPI0013D10F90|nr:hypothetical protein [Candidatus Frankia alpina]